MAIPTYQTLMLPALQAHADGLEQSTQDLVDVLAQRFSLTEEELNERIRSGPPVFRRRVEWARYYLLRALLLERTGRGRARISDRGRALLLEEPADINNALLARYPEFVEWLSASRQGATVPAVSPGPAESPVGDTPGDLSPEERIDAAYDELQRAVEQELLDRVLAMPPGFFEELVVKLLLALGYGGGTESGARLGRSGDGGVDGEIREDALGLEKIYVQAKRWAPGRTVGRPDVQAFSGGLEMHRARKGVFITTSSFSPEAHDFVTRIDKQIVLIDGARLANLMFETNLGLTASRTLQLKRIDSDFFNDSDDL